MINKDIIEAFSMLAKEKDIDRTNLSTIIEDIFMTLIYKKFGEERENFSVIVNMEKGEIEIYQEMLVVKKVLDPVVEINIDDAKNEYGDLDIAFPIAQLVTTNSFFLGTFKGITTEKLFYIKQVVDTFFKAYK